MKTELAFHAIEILILLFGVAAPMVWSALRIRSVLKDYPPHRHINGKIVYPEDYAPSRVESVNL